MKKIILFLLTVNSHSNKFNICQFFAIEQKILANYFHNISNPTIIKSPIFTHILSINYFSLAKYWQK